MDEIYRLIGRRVEIFLLSYHTRPNSLRVPCMVGIYIMGNPCCFCSSRYLLNWSVGAIFVYNLISQHIYPILYQVEAAQKATGRIYYSVIKLQHVTDFEHVIKTSRFMLQSLKVSHSVRNILTTETKTGEQ